MDVILISLGGFILLFVCLRLPQWVADKTGKTIHFRGTFTNYITYKPNEWKKAQQQLKEASDHLEQLNQHLSGKGYLNEDYDSPNNRLTDNEKAEYKLFPLSLRAQLPTAIKEHIVVIDFSDTSERLRIKPWLIKYLELYETVKTLKINELTTLIYGEDLQIEQFKNLYRKNFDSIVQQVPIGTDHKFI